MSRIIMTPKEVQIILGGSSSYARKVVRVIKMKNNKLKHQKITVKEFCRDQGLDLQDVIQELKEFYKKK